MLRDRDLVPPVKKGGTGKKILPALLIGLVLAFGVRQIVHAFFVLPVTVESQDMEPGLPAGSTVYVNRLADPTELKAGDLVLVRHPRSPSYSMIRRVVGLPGDSVQLYNRRLFVNDREVQTPWENAIRGNRAAGGLLPATVTRRDNTEKVTIPPERLFLLGDDRDRALDSRQLGAFHFDSLEGKLMRD